MTDILINGIDVSKIVASGEKIPQILKLSFYLGSCAFLLSVLWIFFPIRKSNRLFHPAESTNLSAKDLLPRFIQSGFIWLASGVLGCLLIYQMEWRTELYILPVSLLVFSLVLLTTAWYTRQGLVHNGFVKFMTGLFNKPKVVKKLIMVQLVSWYMLFALSINSSSAVSGNVYTHILEGASLLIATVCIFSFIILIRNNSKK
jgi:hypothetical protein